MSESKHTPGKWLYDEGDEGHPGGWEEPPDPGYPPTVYVEIEAEGDEDGETVAPQIIILARLDDPQIEYTPHPDDEYDPGIAPYGDVAANTRLMASAPDLLSALDGVLAMLEGVTEGSYERRAERDAAQSDIDAAYAAIAKARGEGKQ